MKTLKVLLPAILAAGTVLLALPETVEAKPEGYNQGQNPRQQRWNRARGRQVSVPELSVGSAAAGLALLGGGLMVLTGRRRQKRDPA